MTGDAASRTELMLGREGVERLSRSFVVLAGCGAVGGYALEALVRAGVGRIRVVDDSPVRESNLNRQILATRGTVGRMKVDVAAERARSINPDIEFEAVGELVSVRNVPDLMSGGPDLLVDAIDTVKHKAFLLRYAAEGRVPTFSSMGASLRTDPGMIRVAKLRRTCGCPLAAAMRDALRDLNTSTITCVYSEEPIRVKPEERNAHMKSVLGSLPTIPAIFGMVLANEAILHLAAGPRDV